ncbi:MAG: rod shape-determining protein MreD [Endomicrobium sp.]|nr:rod shape-determining protein MreD [Endomicrobium sp.]
MRKLILYFLIYIFFCLIQFFFSQYLNSFRIFPNFILVCVVCIGFIKGSFNAQLVGFLFGLTWDIFSTDVFATRALLFTILGYLSGKLNRKFDIINTFFQCVIVFLANIVYDLGLYLINCIIIQDFKDTLTFKNISNIFTTTIVTPFVFYVLRRVLKGI